MNDGPVRILLIDDDDGDILICKESLKAAFFDHELAVCKDGLQALDYLARRPPFAKATRPELILLDINMPRLNGIETLKRIKADPDLKGIPVCMLTTSDADNDVLASYTNHANCYITKPVELDKFMEVVKQIEEFWTRIAKLPSRGAGGFTPPAKGKASKAR